MRLIFMAALPKCLTPAERNTRKSGAAKPAFRQWRESVADD
jgi:hypothetical protein